MYRYTCKGKSVSNAHKQNRQNHKQPVKIDAYITSSGRLLMDRKEQHLFVCVLAPCTVANRSGREGRWVPQNRPNIDLKQSQMDPNS